MHEICENRIATNFRYTKINVNKKKFLDRNVVHVYDSEVFLKYSFAT